jgi:hypothetical protein
MTDEPEEVEEVQQETNREQPEDIVPDDYEISMWRYLMRPRTLDEMRMMNSCDLMMSVVIFERFKLF